MNTKLKKEKNFFKLMNNAVFGKTMGNVRNHRDIKIVTTNRKRNRLASEPNYRTTKCISKNLLIMEMKKVEVKMTKPIYLGTSISDISKILMYKFCYGYIKPKYSDKARLCYMDTDSFVIYIESEDFYKDIVNNVERWFDTSNYDQNDERPPRIGKNKNVIGLFKDELGSNIMTEFVVLRAKTYAYLIDDYNDDDYDKKKITNKKAKGTKK